MGKVEGGAGLIVFPGKAILSPVEAARQLGIPRALLAAMHLMHCGPSPIRVRGQRLYTREELNGFREALLSAFGIDARVLKGGQFRAAGEASDETGAEADPLMKLLCHHRLRHKIIVTSLWSLLVIGLLMIVLRF